LPDNAVRDHGQQVADLFKVRDDIEAAVQMLEQAIEFVENAKEKESRCRDTRRNIPMIIGDNEVSTTLRFQKIGRNINAITYVVFPKTAGRLSRFHGAITNDLDEAARNADVENVIAQLESIRYNDGFIDFIEKFDSFIRVINN
jgi:hypothetical protein